MVAALLHAWVAKEKHRAPFVLILRKPEVAIKKAAALTIHKLSSHCSVVKARDVRALKPAWKPQLVTLMYFHILPAGWKLPVVREMHSVCDQRAACHS